MPKWSVGSSQITERTGRATNSAVVARAATDMLANTRAKNEERRARNAVHAENFSVFPQDSDHAALDFHVRCGNNNRRHFRVRWLQPDFASGLAVEALERGIFP